MKPAMFTLIIAISLIAAETIHAQPMIMKLWPAGVPGAIHDPQYHRSHDRCLCSTKG
jgi:hypothetical protein